MHRACDIEPACTIDYQAIRFIVYSPLVRAYVRRGIRDGHGKYGLFRLTTITRISIEAGRIIYWIHEKVINEHCSYVMTCL